MIQLRTSVEALHDIVEAHSCVDNTMIRDS